MSFIRSARQSMRTAQAGLRAAPNNSSLRWQQPAQSFLRQNVAMNRPQSFHTTATRWALSADARKKIDAAVQAHPLVVFMKGTPEMPMCGFSRAVIQILEVQGVDKDKVKTYNCLDDQDLREGIKEYSSWPTIPQVYVQGEFTGGCDIMLSMHQSGELEQLLQGAKVLLPMDKPSAKANA